MIKKDGTAKTVAVKAPRSQSDDVFNEIRTSLKLKHENVVQCIGFFFKDMESQNIHIVFEFVFYGSLDKILHRSNCPEDCTYHQIEGHLTTVNHIITFRLSNIYITFKKFNF